MYLIVEGMPSSGKTTLAKALAQKYGACYFKSLLPDDPFGNQVRKVRDEGTKQIEINLLHIIDLFRNELQISKMLASGQSVVRDKCFISSLAHCLSVTVDGDYETCKAIKMAYDELYNNMEKPDAFVLLDRSFEDSKNMSVKKQDASVQDEHILGNAERFSLQKKHLMTLAKECYGERLILLSNNEPLEKELMIIEGKVQ